MFQFMPSLREMVVITIFDACYDELYAECLWVLEYKTPSLGLSSIRIHKRVYFCKGLVLYCIIASFDAYGKWMF